ncbi:MAG: hypothetical protein J0L92_15950 [Deltaproteobacteria bacterium]|nr:hypothetical protein [Deltaproteobacteria bacterium]
MRPGSMGIARSAIVLHALLALAGLVPLSACTSSPLDDAGSDAGPTSDAPTTPRRTLTFEGETSLTMAPLAERTLRVRLADDRGEPVVGSVIAFALDGAPRSSTLRQLESTTDASGIGSVVLVAGPQPTTFRLRATSRGAAPAAIDISVGTEFGELVVVLEPEVSRRVESYLVRAVADVSCAAVPSAPSGDERRLGVELAETTFPSLSTAAIWTIVARGQTAGGTTVAQGCVEGVRVSATATARAQVAIRDLPLDPTGNYGVTWTLAAGEVARSVRERALDDVVVDGGAALFLDGLRATLLTGALADVELLDRARGAALDERLTLALSEGDANLEASLAPLLDEVAAGFASLSLEGTLRTAGTEPVSPFLARVGTFVLEGLDTRIERLSVVTGRDAVELAGLEVDVGASALWIAAFEARARARSADGLAGVLRDSASCGTLVTFLTREEVLPSCDARCARAGCAAAAELLLERMRATADDSQSVVRFDATLSSRDDDDDLRADTLDGGGDARWESEDGATTTTLETRFSAVRDDALE